MGYFPFFVELSGQPGLIVGGGSVALRKLEKLLPFGPRLTVVAPEIDPAIRQLEGVRLLECPFAPEDLEGQAFVIAATDSRPVNQQVAALCRARRILVDVADDGSEGTFLFPALVRRGDLTVGISTGGASPGAAAYLRRQVEALLPQRLEEILDFIQTQREQIKSEVPEEARRTLLRRLLEQAMAFGRPLTGEETEHIWRAVMAQEENG